MCENRLAFAVIFNSSYVKSCLLSLKALPLLVCSLALGLLVVIDRYRFVITDTDYLYVYVPDNRYAEPIFIYCYKVNK